MNEGGEWRPAAEPDALGLRAAMLATTREFFRVRRVMEVETPVLCAHGVTDPSIHNLDCANSALRTSPEYHMKRLLADGCPDIYQVGKCFRGGEAGSAHSPEFTMIEWYRLGADLHTIADETCDLIAELADCAGAERPGRTRLSYREAFLAHCDLDPLAVGGADLRDRALSLVGQQLSAELHATPETDESLWLDLLMTHVVQPALDDASLTVIHSYPAAHAMLARIDPVDAHVAERFEVFFRGLELANGFRELTDAAEQRERFAADRAARAAQGLPDVAPDTALLAALEAGLPDCAGVALGLDRVMMACGGYTDISATMSFRPGE